MAHRTVRGAMLIPMSVAGRLSTPGAPAAPVGSPAETPAARQRRGVPAGSDSSIGAVHAGRVPHARSAQRSPARASLSVALRLVVICLVALAAIEVGSPSGTAGSMSWWQANAMPLSALVFAAMGWLAWSRRPANRTGAIMVVGAGLLLASSLVNVPIGWLGAVSTVLATATLSLLVHLLLAFPSGTLRGTTARMTVIAGYGVSLVLQMPLYLFDPARSPDGMLAIVDRPDLAAIASRVQQGAGAAVMVVTATICAARLAHARPQARRVLAPLYLYGILAVIAVPLLPQVIVPLTGMSPATSALLQVAVISVVPIAVGASMLLGGFARTSEVQELEAWLGTHAGGHEPIRDAMAAALGDTSLRLAFWVADPPGYVGGRGQPVDAPGTGSGRACVTVRLADAPVAAIEYDAALIDDPELVAAAGRVLALALDRERLTAALLASEREVRRSRVRIVEAGDRARHRIAQNLHDGLQADLVLLGLQAQNIADIDGAATDVAEAAQALRRQIDRASDELRALVHAVMPPALAQQGLTSALEDLADRMPIPTVVNGGVPADLPPAVQATAYFIVAEAMTNAIKHAGAKRITVHLGSVDGVVTVRVGDDGVGGAERARAGLGLSGMRDRVDALGGRLTVQSPAGAGTDVVAELPCE